MMNSKELREGFEGKDEEYVMAGKTDDLGVFVGMQTHVLNEKLDLLMEAMCELLDRSELDE